MIKNKFFFLFLSLFLITGFLFIVPTVSASNDNGPVYYNQDFDLCYTGCAAWKLY